MGGIFIRYTGDGLIWPSSNSWNYFKTHPYSFQLIMITHSLVTIAITSDVEVKHTLAVFDPPFYIVNRSTRSLYRVGPDRFLSSVHDPYTGDQVKVDKVQNYISSLDLVGWVFHTIFLDDEELPCTDTGVRYKLKPKPLSIWNNAMLELTFT